MLQYIYSHSSSTNALKCINLWDRIHLRGAPILHHLQLSAHLALLERVLDRIILPDNNLPLLLSRNMLNPHLLREFSIELANETRIPQFAGDAQVLAAAHQGIGLAPLGRSRDAIRVEVLLFSARYRHKTVGAESVHKISQRNAR